MMMNTTLDQLRELKLHGLHAGLQEQLTQAGLSAMSFEERIALLVDREVHWRGDKRREFLRVRRNADGGLDLFPNQSSGVLTSASWADGLVDNPPGRAIARGDAVRFLPLAELLQ